MPNQVLKINDDVTVINESQQKFFFLFVISIRISAQNLSKIGKETKKLQKIRKDVIVTSFIKIARHFLRVSCFYS